MMPMRYPPAAALNVPESQHSIFIRGFPGDMDMPRIKDFFEKEAGHCTFDFFKQSQDKLRLYVAVRFDSRDIARQCIEQPGASKVERSGTKRQRMGLFSTRMYQCQFACLFENGWTDHALTPGGFPGMRGRGRFPHPGFFPPRGRGMYRNNYHDYQRRDGGRGGMVPGPGGMGYGGGPRFGPAFDPVVDRLRKKARQPSRTAVRKASRSPSSSRSRSHSERGSEDGKDYSTDGSRSRTRSRSITPTKTELEDREGGEHRRSRSGSKRRKRRPARRSESRSSDRSSPRQKRRRSPSEASDAVDAEGHPAEINGDSSWIEYKTSSGRVWKRRPRRRSQRRSRSPSLHSERNSKRSESRNSKRSESRNSSRERISSESPVRPADSPPPKVTVRLDDPEPLENIPLPAENKIPEAVPLPSKWERVGELRETQETPTQDERPAGTISVAPIVISCPVPVRKGFSSAPTRTVVIDRSPPSNTTTTRRDQSPKEKREVRLTPPNASPKHTNAAPPLPSVRPNFTSSAPSLPPPPPPKAKPTPPKANAAPTAKLVPTAKPVKESTTSEESRRQSPSPVTAAAEEKNTTTSSSGGSGEGRDVALSSDLINLKPTAETALADVLTGYPTPGGESRRKAGTPDEPTLEKKEGKRKKSKKKDKSKHLRLSSLTKETGADAERQRHIASLGPERLGELQRKRKDLEAAYKQDCETFATVVKMLISKEPTLEDKLLPSMRESLKDIGQKFISELNVFVDNLVQADAENNL